MKNASLRGALCLFAVLPLVGCEQVFFAEVDVPQVCQKLPSQQFEGVPPQFQQGKLERDFDYEVGQFLEGAEMGSLEGEAQLLSMTMSRLADSPALTFIDAASVQLLAPEGTELPPLKLIDYQKQATDSGDALNLVGGKIDVLPYLRAGKVKLKTSLEGTLPSEPWSADVEACFHLRARVYYYETLQGQL